MFKVDFQNDFDSLSCDYLDQVMRAIGFGDK